MHKAKLGLVLGCVALVGGAVACNPAIYVSGEQTAHAKLRDYSLEDLTRIFNRQSQAAKDIQVSATLWDLAYIIAFQEARTTRKEQSAEVAKTNIEAWRKRFVQGKTSFRVRVELLNRGEVLRGQDRILELKQWSWKLRFSDGKTVPYNHIHVELAKRFKAREGGGYHYRLDGVVHFPVRVDPSKHSYIELRAYPPGDRPAAKMRWNLKQP